MLKADQEFGRWREKRLPWLEPETARLWMNAYRNDGERLLQNNLGATSVYLLTAPSAPETAPASANTGANLAGLNVTPDAMARKMSSREIAELTGKRHKNVIQDIRNLIEQGAITGLNFQPSEYRDASGKSNPEYLLDFDATMTLVTGYNAVLRAKVIKRWRELETSTAVKQAPEPAPCKTWGKDNLPTAANDGRRESILPDSKTYYPCVHQTAQIMPAFLNVFPAQMNGVIFGVIHFFDILARPSIYVYSRIHF